MRLSSSEWFDRGLPANCLTPTVHIDANSVEANFGDGLSRVSVTASSESTLIRLGDMRLLAGKDSGILTIYVGGEKPWLVLWEGPLGKTLMDQEASPIRRRTPGEAEAYKQGYRAALQYVRETLDGVLLP